jgi:hypothetical protein
MGNSYRRGDDLTMFLFARPSALEGFARIADIFGTLNEYNRSSNPDAIAIRNDWRAVGHDIEDAAATVMGDDIA